MCSNVPFSSFCVVCLSFIIIFELGEIRFIRSVPLLLSTVAVIVCLLLFITKSFLWSFLAFGGGALAIAAIIYSMHLLLLLLCAMLRHSHYSFLLSAHIVTIQHTKFTAFYAAVQYVYVQLFLSGLQIICNFFRTNKKSNENDDDGGSDEETTVICRMYITACRYYLSRLSAALFKLNKEHPLLIFHSLLLVLGLELVFVFVVYINVLMPLILNKTEEKIKRQKIERERRGKLKTLPWIMVSH